jgi:hypothetical protein
MIKILKFSDPKPENSIIINTTSKSNIWTKELSPFYLKGGLSYDGTTAYNVENLYQYCKVYPQYTDLNGEPSDLYFQWAKNGWQSKKAERYPVGKGQIPLYFYWKGKKYNYLEAKEKIYIKLYSRAVIKTTAFERLKDIYKNCQSYGLDLVLLDFDAYDHISIGHTYQDVVKDSKRKYGHAFVLAFLLDNVLDAKFNMKQI